MDRITESLVKSFCEEHDLTGLEESKRFEHFVSYAIVKKDYSPSFDTYDIVVGADDRESGGESGMDGIAILVNGILITDEADLGDLQRSDSWDVSFLLIQTETSSGWHTGKIGTFGSGVRDFFREQPSLDRNKKVTLAATISDTIYRNGPKFKKGRPACTLYYVTTGRLDPHDVPMNARITEVTRDLEATGLFRSVQFIPLGAEGIQSLYHKAKNARRATFKFSRNVSVGSDATDVAYFGSIPWSEYKNIICDENGTLQTGLFFDNVRAWQGYNEVNKEIGASLKSPTERARFAFMNNGVTVIAQNLFQVGDKFTIEDYQIVNGCQTSHVLYENESDLDASVNIPIRLIKTSDEEAKNSIIKATNRQTQIKAEQLFALQEFPKGLESFCGAFPEQQRIYFERRDGQYDATGLDKSRIITMSGMIRVFAAMFLNEPHRTTTNFSAIKQMVGKYIFVRNHKMEAYHTAAFAHYKIGALFRNRKLDRKYSPAKFHMLMVMRMLQMNSAAKVKTFGSKQFGAKCAGMPGTPLKVATPA
jgi:hypothetical protein